MVEEADFSNFGKLDKPLGELDVGLTGRGVAGRMVVRDHDCHRAPLERLFEYIAGERRRGIRRAA